MTENEKSGVKPEKVSSKDEFKSIVSTIDYGVKVRITEYSDGSQACDVRDVTVEDPHKDPAPEMAVTSPQDGAPVAAVPATLAAAVPRELPNGKEPECSICETLKNLLQEQVKVASPRQQPAPREQGQSTPAPRQQLSHRGQSRRMSQS